MIRKLIFISVISLFYPCASCYAYAESLDSLKKSDFDINGLRIGDELSEKFLNKYCPFRHDDKTIECKQNVILGGVKLSVLYFFHDEKLLSISFEYPSSEYHSLVNNFKRKLSKLPSREVETISTGTGDKYMNNISSWDTNDGMFVIKKYGTSLTKGVAYLKSDRYEDYLNDKKKDYTPGYFKKIFGNIFD